MRGIITVSFWGIIAGIIRIVIYGVFALSLGVLLWVLFGVLLTVSVIVFLRHRFELLVRALFWELLAVS